MVIFTLVIDEEKRATESLKIDNLGDLKLLIEALGKYRDGYTNILLEQLEKSKEESNTDVDNT